MDSSEESERNVFTLDSKELATYLTTVQKMYTMGESRENVFCYFLNSMTTLMPFKAGFIAEMVDDHVHGKIFKTIAIKNGDDDNSEVSIPITHAIFNDVTKQKPYFIKKGHVIMGWNTQCLCIVPFYDKEDMTGVIVLASDIDEYDIDKILPMKYICASLLKGFRTQSLKDIYENIVNCVSIPILVFTKDPVNMWIKETNGIDDITLKTPKKYYSVMQVSSHDLSLFNCIVCNEAFHQMKRNNNQNHYNVHDRSQFSNKTNELGKYFYDCFPNMIDNDQIHSRWLDMWKTGNKTIIDAMNYYDINLVEDLYSIEFNKLDQRTFMMIVCPVSEQLRAKELIHSLAKTQEEFVGKISHELRTPVNAILSILSLLYDSPFAKQQGEASNDFREKLQMMSESSVTLCSLIQDVLDYTQLESKTLNISYKTFDLVECVDNAISMISTESDRKGLLLTRSITSDVPLCVVSDPKRLKQILVNLLSNAVKFTTHGSIKIDISTSRTANNVSVIQFAIKDTGVGISNKDLNKLFKPFSQIYPNDSGIGGTGLGLIISKHIANLLGGEIWVESERGKGSTFYFTIKARVCSLDSIKDYYGPILKHKSVLVVDSNQESRNKLTSFLLDQETQTTSTESVDIALTYLQASMYHFDLVLTDISHLQLIQKYHNNIITIKDCAKSNRRSSRELHESHELGEEDQIDNDHKSVCRPIDQLHLLQLCYSSLAKCARNTNVYKFHSQNNHIHNTMTDIKCDLKILIVEDDYINSKVLHDILVKLGYSEISEAENGQEALNIMREKTFDVILLDLKMPIMNGYQFFETLKQQKLKKMPYTIALTASAMLSDKERCLNMGMNQYLAKPLDISVLRTILLKIKLN